MAPIQGNDTQFATPVATTTGLREANKEKKSFWEELLEEHLPRTSPTLHAKLTPDMVLKSSSLEQVIEKVAGLNVNPFLGNGSDGHYRAPDGANIPLSVLAIKKHWPTVRAQRGSLGDGCQLLHTSAKTDREFTEELMSYARQMDAHGAGLCLLMASLTSPGGELHARFREIVLHEVMGAWEHFMIWEDWCGLSEETVRLHRVDMISQFGIWTSAWAQLTTRMIAVYDHLVEPVDVRLELVERYSALRRCVFNTVDAMKRSLREESELALRIAGDGMVFSWPERRKLRLKMVQAIFTTAVAPFVSSFDTTTGVFEFNEVLESMLVSMGVDSTVPLPGGVRPSLPMAQSSVETAAAMKLPLKQEVPSERKIATETRTFFGNCDNCGTGGHMARFCPKLTTDPLKRSERLGELAAMRMKGPEASGPVQKKLGGFAGSAVMDSTTGMRCLTVETPAGQLKFGLDSGLDLSLIRRDCVLYSNDVAIPTNVKLQSLSGHQVAVREVQFCELQVSLPGQGRTVTVSASIGVWDGDLPNGVAGLIGNDIIQRHPVILHSAFRIPESAPEVLEPAAEGPLTEEELKKIVVGLNLPVMCVDITQQHPTIRGRGYPTQPAWCSKANEIIDDLVERDIVRDVTDQADADYGWVSPGFFVQKGSDELKLRFVVDFRVVNGRIKPPYEEAGEGVANFCLSIPRDMEWFASVDIKDAFYAVKVDEASQNYLRASVRIAGKERVLQFLRGPQGLSTTPTWWRSFINELCRGLQHHWKQTSVDGGYRIYVDDVLVFARTRADAERLINGLGQLLTALGIPFGKVQQPGPEVRLLGCLINRVGWRIDPLNITKLKGLRLTSKDDIRSALGLIQYLHSAYPSSEFASNFSTLSSLTSKNNHFVWGAQEQAAWDFFCDRFDERCYEYGIEDLRDGEYWIMQVDACDHGYAAVLWRSSQLPDSDCNLADWFASATENGICKRIAVKQHSFSSQETRYPVWDRESLAVFGGLSAFQNVLLASLGADPYGRIVVYSDSSATVGRWKQLLEGGPLSGSITRIRRWLRWCDDISELLATRPRFLNIPGSENGVADFFSRVLSEDTVYGGLSGIIASNDPTLTTSTLPTENFDFTHFQNQIRDLQKTTDERYQKVFLRELINEIPEPLLSFTNETGLLHFMNRLYVPDGLIEMGGRTLHARTLVIHLCHDMAHPGITRTMSLLHKYWWPRMQADVANYIKSCHSCQVQKARQVNGRITGRNVADRFNVIVIDHCKPPPCVWRQRGQLLFSHQRPVYTIRANLPLQEFESGRIRRRPLRILDPRPDT